MSSSIRYNRFLYTLMDIMLVLAAITAIVSLILVVFADSSSTDSTNRMAIAALALAAMSGLATLRMWMSDKRVRTSDMYRTRVLIAWNDAVDILDTAKHDRVKWLATARIIKLADRLRMKVTEKVDTDSLAMDVETIREKLWHHLENTASFYLGRPDITKLADADKEEKRNGYSREIPLYAIHAIYSLIQYPKPYVDPLEKNKEYTFDDFSGLPCESGGLKEYIAYKLKRKSGT